MPLPQPTFEPQQLRSLISELRGDFSALRQIEPPIKITLSHRATNAEAEGVKPYPLKMEESVVAFTNAGHRDFRQNFDERGNPKIIDNPVIGPTGEPFVNSAGQAFDVTMPAFRRIDFAGSHDGVARLRGFAVRAGRIASACRHETLRLLAGWRFGDSEELWWGLVFEVAWSGRHPLLSAKRQLCQVADNGGLAFYPYDLAELERLTKVLPDGALIPRIPDRWLRRLPDAFVSELDDAVSACIDLTGILLDELTETDTKQQSDVSEQAKRSSKSVMTDAPNAEGFVASPADPTGFASRFRILAEDFRACAAASTPRPSLSEFAPLRFRTLKYLSRAGQLVIEAYQAGALQLDGLAELVAYHTTPSDDKPAKGKTVKVRCPENLFTELAGANQVEFMNTEPAAVSPVRSGGLLPQLGLLPESTPEGAERYARACEKLAELVRENHATKSLETFSVRDKHEGPRRPRELSEDKPALEPETFSVYWKGKTVKLGNTKQFRLLQALLEAPSRYQSFADLAETMGGDSLDDIKPIKSRLCKELRDSGLAKLAKSVKTESGHYGLFLS